MKYFIDSQNKQILATLSNASEDVVRATIEGIKLTGLQVCYAVNDEQYARQSTSEKFYADYSCKLQEIPQPLYLCYIKGSLTINQIIKKLEEEK